jgi:hypothetical protein
LPQTISFCEIFAPRSDVFTPIDIDQPRLLQRLAHAVHVEVQVRPARAFALVVFISEALLATSR